MLALVLLLGFAGADIPVNCNYLQIVGSWTFHLNPETFTARMTAPESTCGHGQPDQVVPIEAGKGWSFPNEDLYRVSLIEPNLASAQAWGGGSWTMIANEGFMVKFPGITLVAYSMYSNDPDSGAIYSECDKTMIGWYSPADPKDHSDWGCFYAVKDGAAPPKELVSQDKAVWVSPTSFLQSATQRNYEEHNELIAKINGVQSEWKAGVNDYFVGMSMVEVNKRVGIRRNIKTQQNGESPYISLLQTATKSALSTDTLKQLSKTDSKSLTAFLNTPLDQIPVEALPKEWDWTNVDGESFVTPRKIDQGNCGSCYAISTIGMLESRLRIQSKKNKDIKLSIQYAVACNFYTEGCNGGFPTLVSKFISEFGIPSESCLKYSATDDNCAAVCDDAEQWASVDEFGYLGGYYGAATEELMMKELRARGPFAVSFEPGYEFSFYVGGVYQQVANRFDGDESMRDNNLPWEQVDHSVLLVGWGEENGKPYWKLLNSWGDRWGEKGFFRMRRGKDESGIESMAEIAVPRLSNGPLTST